MMRNARRTVVSTLILALLASLAPVDAYASLARAAGATGARGPVVTGVSGVSGGLRMPAASLSLSLTPASLVSGVPVLHDAPRMAAPLSPSALIAPADAPQAPQAPGAPRQAGDAAETPSPAVEPAPTTPAAEAPSAEAPAAGRSLFGGLKAILQRAVPRNGMAPDLDKGLDRVFDGAGAKKGTAEPAPVFSVQATAGRWALRRFAKHAHNRAKTTDDFGGPKPLGPTTTTRKVGYGLKWGLNMVGIVALYDLLLAPLLTAVPWPAFLGDAALEAFGRVALLTQLGPTEIAAALSLAPGTFLGLPLLATVAVALAAKPLVKALTSRGPLANHARPVQIAVYGAAAAFALLSFASAPGAFLGMSLPVLVALEEVSFRVISFLPAFAALALTRPVMNWLAGQLDAIPNHAGVRGFVQGVMRFIGGTFAWYAYPFAAVMASMSFATAHFANWGVDPYVFFVQFTLGMILTRVAYRSESLTAPITAHLAFNTAMFGGPLLFAMGYTGLAMTYTVLAAVVGAVFLLYNYLSYRKDRAAAKKGLFTAGKTLSAAVLATGLAFGAAQMTGSAPTYANWGAQQPRAVLVQDAQTGVPGPAPEVAGATAQADPAAPVAAAPVESRADVIARIAPSVFRVNVGNSLGTGFIISPQGLAVSNAHVTGDTPVGGYVEVVIPNAPILRARVLAVNHDKDIALLQLPQHPSGAWPALTIAGSAPRVGEETIAIGYPMGLDQTVTRGIVSGVGRHLNMYVAHIQTDASINPGNSGGPLFNERGEVIGVNTLIVTRNGGSVGLGFSIMAPDLVRAVQQYAATGDMASGRMGVIINLSDPFKPEQGLAIEHVRPGSGAAAAGLRRGDLIVGIGPRRLVEGGEMAAQRMAAALAQTVPGQKLVVTVLRGEQVLSVEVTIDAKHSRASH